MTEKLYGKDQYIRKFRANVLSCVKNGDKYYVILDKTAFFPEGGGQPGDRGIIGGVKVIDTQEQGEDILHICDGGVSGEADCEIDWDFRFLNMQQHTGEHIFSGIMHSETGFDNVGFHMGENEVTVDFNGSVSPETLELVEKKANEAIWKNTAVEEILPPDDELENYDYRSKKELSGQVRLIRIEGADLCACCGTHTARTGEVGMIKAVNMMKYKQGVRIRLKIGARALEDYTEKNGSVYDISALLCAKTEEVAEAVAALKERMAREHFRFNELKKKYYELKIEGISAENPVIFDDSGSADDARMIADMLAEKLGTGIAFSGDDENGYKYAVVSRNADARETGKKINAALNGRGGGKPEMVTGTVSATREQITKSVISKE